MNIREFFNKITRGKSSDVLENFTFFKGNFDEYKSKLKGKKGIYAWYLMPSETDDDGLNDYYKVFNNKNFTATFESEKFSEIYKGKDIKSDWSEKFKKEIREESFTKESKKAFQFSALLFSSPIYIGKSKDLAKRISCHFEKLNEKISLRYSQLDDVNEDEQDDSNKSEVFATRICKLVRDEDKKNPWDMNNFIVRVIVFNNEEINDEKVTKIEKVLNRIFKPAIGIK